MYIFYIMAKKYYKTTYKYYIMLFCNKKRKKLLHKSARRGTITEYWNELKTQEPPSYVKLTSGRKRTELQYELVLIYPKTRWSKKTYVRDSLGRTIEAKINNDKQRIKEVFPYWEEELIYDFDDKKRIRYHEMMNYILKVDEVAQLFILNKNLFVQVENKIKMYGNRNIEDANRLFEIVKNELLNKKRKNFLFVKDISTTQRIHLYDLLESKGYKRTELFRHYSY